MTAQQGSSASPCGDRVTCLRLGRARVGARVVDIGGMGSQKIPLGEVRANLLAELRVRDAAACFQRRIGEVHEIIDPFLEIAVIEPEQRAQQLARELDRGAA